MCPHKIAPPQKKDSPVYIYIYRERESGVGRWGLGKILEVLKKVFGEKKRNSGRRGLCP